MPKTINIHEAKTHLSRIVEEVADGSEVIIAKAGKPIARLVPLEHTPAAKHLGLLKGKFRVPRNFNAPLPAEVLKSFEDA